MLILSSIRRLILAVIEDPYSNDQLREPRMNVLIVKPLVDRLYEEDDISVGRYLTFLTEANADKDCSILSACEPYAVLARAAVSATSPDCRPDPGESVRTGRHEGFATT